MAHGPYYIDTWAQAGRIQVNMSTYALLDLKYSADSFRMVYVSF